MAAQLESNKPTVNGYSGMIPSGWAVLANAKINSRAQLSILEQDLEKWSIQNNLDSSRIQLIIGGNLSSLPVCAPDQFTETDGSVRLIFGSSNLRSSLLSGWSIDEGNGHETWVWANELASEMCVSLKKDKPYEMTMHLIPLAIPNKNQSIALFLNGTFLSHLNLNNGSRIYKLVVPPDMVKNINILQFRYDYAAAPLNGDTRNLAVMFKEILFSPIETNADAK